jgi:hypothetical protein
VLTEAGRTEDAIAVAVAGERPGYAHVYLVAVSLWLAAYGYLPQATRLAAVTASATTTPPSGNWTSEQAS